MIRYLLRNILIKFGKDHDYDTGYICKVSDIWPTAGLRYLFLSAVTQMKGPDPDTWAGALLASTLDGDCGPCAQLVTGFALRENVPADHIAACLSRDFDAAGKMGLGFQFAEAVIAGHPNADGLRDRIRAAHGEKAVIAASYAAASGRVYPVMKRALGHGSVCKQIRLEGADISVVRPSP